MAAPGLATRDDLAASQSLAPVAHGQVRRRPQRPGRAVTRRLQGRGPQRSISPSWPSASAASIARVIEQDPATACLRPRRPPGRRDGLPTRPAGPALGLATRDGLTASLSLAPVALHPVRRADGLAARVAPKWGATTACPTERGRARLPILSREPRSQRPEGRSPPSPASPSPPVTAGRPPVPVWVHRVPPRGHNNRSLSCSTPPQKPKPPLKL